MRVCEKMELCQRSNEFKNYLHFENIPTIAALFSGAGTVYTPQSLYLFFWDYRRMFGPCDIVINTFYRQSFEK
jgi:hypothetical protein